MNIYWQVVAITIILGVLIPQRGNGRTFYIFLMFILHTFVCGFRYMDMTGDLKKYHYTYNTIVNYGWFSNDVFNEGRNGGFYMFMKLVSSFSHENFQLFLFILAFITEILVAWFIYRYSSKPVFSYIVWNCMSFFVVYGFSTIKQGLAMSILLVSMGAILDEKPKTFLIATLLAGFVHMPALAFLPAYWIARRHFTTQMFFVYLSIAAIIFLRHEQIVGFLSDMYYEEEKVLDASFTLGGRFLLISLILVAGIILRGFRSQWFEMLFNMMLVAALFQMFSVYDNVFTRWADYYFQFSILYIPFLFYERSDEPYYKYGSQAWLPFDDKSLRILSVVVVLMLIWWYNQTLLGHADLNYLSFKFMWQ